jgi:hypothetical protein
MNIKEKMEIQKHDDDDDVGRPFTSHEELLVHDNDTKRHDRRP